MVKDMAYTDAEIAWLYWREIEERTEQVVQHRAHDSNGEQIVDQLQLWEGTGAGLVCNPTRKRKWWHD